MFVFVGRPAITPATVAAASSLRFTLSPFGRFLPTPYGSFQDPPTLSNVGYLLSAIS